MEKNRDTFSQDLKELIEKSDNQFLRAIFAQNTAEDKNKRNVTLSFQFKQSLDNLMKALNACHPFFVRCIKPNENKAAQVIVFPLLFSIKNTIQ